MGLRGTPFLYYGDEIGMIDTDVPDGPHPRPGRRVPRRAHGSRRRAHADAVDAATPGAGFSSRRRAVAPVRRLSRACNVADQRHDPDSMLSLTRDLIGLRDAMPELRDGAYRTLPRAERRRVGVAARRAHGRRVQPVGRARRHRRRRSRRDPHLDDPRPRQRARRRPVASRTRGKPRSSGGTHDGHRALACRCTTRRGARLLRGRVRRGRSSRVTSTPPACSRSRSSGSAAPTSGSRPTPMRARTCTPDAAGAHDPVRRRARHRVRTRARRRRDRDQSDGRRVRLADREDRRSVRPPLGDRPPARRRCRLSDGCARAPLEQLVGAPRVDDLLGRHAALGGAVGAVRLPLELVGRRARRC